MMCKVRKPLPPPPRKQNERSLPTGQQSKPSTQQSKHIETPQTKSSKTAQVNLMKSQVQSPIKNSQNLKKPLNKSNIQATFVPLNHPPQKKTKNHLHRLGPLQFCLGCCAPGAFGLRPSRRLEETFAAKTAEALKDRLFF